MNSFKWLSDDKQLFWQSMVATFREVERNIERNLHIQTGLTFVDFTLLIALYEVENGILHVDKIYDRLRWNRPRALLHTNRLEEHRFTHTRDHGEDPDLDYVVVLIGVGRHIFTEATPDCVDTVHEKVVLPLASEDREVILRRFQATLDRE